MRALWLVPLLLAGCDQPKQDSTALALRSGEQSAEITQIKAEVDDLKSQIIAIKTAQEADRALGVDTYNNLNGLRKTVNNNVEIDNKRNGTLIDHVNALDRRLGMQ